ncbi:hypothetical protein DNTS_025957 [Danionella cerebrum]|uniref:KH domain-containing, RNA-binding, signal transduction-associated protein 1 n=1 Tax=Danionella cerebrum TaxID=2873325 RepID=A0A553R821_9TELE|nr:hypothetical protein DNTS_025957 [Danionella translucida]
MDPNNRKNGAGDSKYLPELLAEKDSLDSSFTHSMKLLDAEIGRIQKGEPKKDAETYLDLFANKNVRVRERVLIPVKQYPRFNFVGKILGPQGSTIKRLQEDTGAKISVLGKGSMRDKNKEEELRKGGDPKYAHLGMELHVFVEVFAPIPDCYLRMAHAMDEVKKFLMPVEGFDEMHPDAFMDPGFLNGSQDMSGLGRGLGRGRGGPHPMGVVVCLHVEDRAAEHQEEGQDVVREQEEDLGDEVALHLRLPPEGVLQHAPDHQLPPREWLQPLHLATSSMQSKLRVMENTDTEYYDYGHGEAQESYESYTEDDWEGGTWGGAGGKAPSARQGKSFREHPYGRY